MRKKCYKLLDHTADIGIELFADDFTSLLENAAFALFDIITDISKVRPRNRVATIILNTDREDMMRSWMEELLFRFNSADYLFSKFKVTDSDTGYAHGDAWGEVFDANRHMIHTEIKGITYHQFEVSRSQHGWYCRIIFDV